MGSNGEVPFRIWIPKGPTRRQYGPSVTDRIRQARTAEEAYAVVVAAAKDPQGASTGTIRKWRKAAEQKARSLEAA